MTNQNPITIVSIATDQSGQPLPDLNSIVSTLGSGVNQFNWLLHRLDALGPNAESLCGRVELAGDDGLWLSTEQLFEETAGITQTIEGELLGFPNSIDRSSIGYDERFWLRLPTSRAQLAIVAIDGMEFDILSKDNRLISNLRNKWHVTDQSITDYFPALTPVS